MLGGDPRYVDLGRRVARELTVLIERRGKPGIMIVSDNGPSSLQTPCSPGRRTIVWHFITPGKPMQNGFL